MTEAGPAPKTPVKTESPASSAARVGAPDAVTAPTATSPSPPRPSRFVGAAAVAGTTAATAPPKTPDGERDQLTPPAPPPKTRRKRGVSARLVVLLVVLVLIVAGAGAYLYKRHHSPSKAPAVPPGQAQADQALAPKIGILAADLPGWKAVPGSPGDAFAPTSANPAATSRALSALSQCLHVPAIDITRAFGAASAARSATLATPTYSDPAAAGTEASSVVDIMKRAGTEHADDRVFANPNLFATCYQAYAQSTVSTATAAAPPTTVIVTPTTAVPQPTNSRVHVAAFVITRSGNGVNGTTTAVAIFGGRIQATLDLVSPSTTFPSTNSLVSAVEGRVVANLPAGSS